MKRYLRSVRWLFVLVAIVSLSGCEFFREQPVNLSVHYVRDILALAPDAWVQRAPTMGIRERQAFDYLRALREQNRTLAVDVSKVDRPDEYRRVILIVVNEVHGAAGEPRARLLFHVERGADKKWTISRVELVE